MAKTIIISDLHLGKFWKSNNSAFSRARKLIQSLVINLNKILEEYYDENLHLIIAGDVFDSVHANTEMLIYIKQNLFEVLSKFPKITVIAGNHETFIDKEGQQQTLLDLCMTNNAIINNKIITKNIINNINYIFIPHQNNLTEVFDWIIDNQDNWFEKDYINAIVSHMTPNEIFSFEKYKISDFIDKINYNIPYIFLGHYHRVKKYKHKNTTVFSIGNSYYNTIDDMRHYRDEPKRFLVVDEKGKVTSKSYILPKVYEFELDNQADFDNELIEMVKSKINIDDIVFIRSKNLIDYSALTMEGYDIYYDLIEDADNKISILQETIDTNIDTPSGSTLNERWEKYINGIEITDRQRKLANWLFSKRNDSDINCQNLSAVLKE